MTTCDNATFHLPYNVVYCHIILDPNKHSRNLSFCLNYFECFHLQTMFEIACLIISFADIESQNFISK